MRVLISGSSGFIGRHISQALTRDGHECIPLDRSGRNPKPDQVDAVINLGGESVVGRWTTAKKASIMDSRVNATRELVEWMRQMPTPPEVFLSASAVGFYGDRGNEALDEQSAPDPAHKFRSLVCLRWEEEANRAKELGVRVVNLRIGGVLDASGGIVGELAKKFAWSPILVPFAPKSYIPWISMTDTVGAMQFALANKAVDGPVNLVSPEPATYGEVFRALAFALHKRTLLSVPSWTLKLALGEFSQALLESQKISPTRLLAFGYQFKEPGLQKMLVRTISQTQKVTNSRPVK